jgi:hypothetical protein
MAFVNEFIPPEDVEKYQLAEIDKRFVVGGTSSRQWTIDRRRDVYLRNVARGGGGDPDIRNQTEWTLYWHGDLLVLRLDLLEGRGQQGEPGWSHWRLVWFCGTSGLPAHLKSQKTQILDALKEALTAYQGAGVYSGAYTSYSVTLDISEGCAL